MPQDEVSSAVPEAQPPDRGFLREHLALTISVGVIVAFAIHLIVVAHGDPETALALVRVGGPSAALIPLGVTALASIFASFVAVVGPSVLCDPRTRPAWAIPMFPRTVAWIACLVPAFFLLPAVFTVIFAATTFVWLWAGPSEAKTWAKIEQKAASGDAKAQRQLERRARGRARNWLAFFVIFGLVIVVLSLLDDGVWLPAERITNAQGATIGYVLVESDHDLVVLNERNRQVERINKDTHTTRTFCTITEKLRTLAAYTLWRGSTADYPVCEKLKP